MNWIQQTLADDPFWLWLVIGAVILGAEVATGTGWLLWAAASAGVVGLLALLLPNSSFPLELGVFAALTIATALTARRFLPSAFVQHGPDINDNVARIVGRKGLAASAFKAGAGRVSIDGKEWAAELDGGEEALARGAAVEVTGVHGAKLTVKTL